MTTAPSPRPSGLGLAARSCAIAVALLAAAALAPRRARAELGDLEISTLEYATDIGRNRQLGWKRRVETVSMPASKLTELTLDRRSALDPRPALEQDAPLWRRLGAVGWDASPADLDWPLLTGLYRPEEDRIVLAQKVRGERGQAAHVIAVHLALLDQRTPFASLERASSRDQQLAREAYLLGDAALTWLSRREMPQGDDLAARQRWAARQLDAALRPQPADGPSFGERYARARIREGLEALVAVRQTSPWGVVDELFARGVPYSTAEILHPDRLLEASPPRAVHDGPIAALASRGEPETGVLGELRMRLWLETWLTPEVAERVTSGWTGDRYALYRPTSAGEPWTSTLVLLTTWELGADGAAEAEDFAGGLLETARARLGGDAAPVADAAPGATVFRDDRGLALLVERRDELVLYVEGCPAELAATVRDQVWSGWQLQNAAMISGPVAPPPPIVQEPPPVPWYRRTPGLVALGLWLLVILPLLGYAGTRAAGLNPVRIYVFGLVGTLVVVVVGWLLGL